MKLRKLQHLTWKWDISAKHIYLKNSQRRQKWISIFPEWGCANVGKMQNCPQGFYNAINSTIKCFQGSYFRQHPVLKCPLEINWTCCFSALALSFILKPWPVFLHGHEIHYWCHLRSCTWRVTLLSFPCSADKYFQMRRKCCVPSAVSL